jgi:N-acyl-L-homoserine lactone synthetase
LKIKSANSEYIEKIKLLSDEEIERLQSRMGSKLTRRAEDKKLSITEALAIQLEKEDEELEEWREKRAQLLAKSEAGEKSKKNKSKKSSD